MNETIWKDSQYGYIPADAVIGGKENDRSVYVVRFKTKEGQMILGKLIQGMSIAVGSFRGVRTSLIYQILINPKQERTFRWIAMDIHGIPSNALRIRYIMVMLLDLFIRQVIYYLANSMEIFKLLSILMMMIKRKN